MLIGYMRVSKSNGSQALDLQRDALLAVGVDLQHIYEIWRRGGKAINRVWQPAPKRYERVTPWWSGSSIDSDATCVI